MTKKILLALVYCALALTTQQITSDNSGFIVSAHADEAEIEFWRSVKDTKSAEELKAYLQVYPNGKFSALAKLRLKKLGGASKPKKVPAKSQPKNTAETYKHLNVFGDVLERVRSDYVKKPNDAALIEAAIDGMLKAYPSQAIEQKTKASLKEARDRKGKASAKIYTLLNVFGEFFEQLRNEAGGQIEDGELISRGINAMLVSLDAYSIFWDAKAFQDLQNMYRDDFAGLGIEVTLKNGAVKVIVPLDNSPAAQAGVRAGDAITHVDGTPLTGRSLVYALENMRGKVGTTARLTVVRKGIDQPLSIDVKRAKSRRSPSVTSELMGEIGYVRITTFNEQTTDQLKAAIQSLRANAGGSLKGYILDLRNNPGGLFDQAVSVVDVFLQRGEIVSMRGRNPEEKLRYNAKNGDLTDGAPLVVLINEGSASASEIVAAALKDHQRATVLGARSFGKGTVQTIIPLGKNGAMRLTTAIYHQPTGATFNEKGVPPDVVVEQGDAGISAAERHKDEQLKHALLLPKGIKLSADDPSDPTHQVDDDAPEDVTFNRVKVELLADVKRNPPSETMPPLRGQDAGFVGVEVTTPNEEAKQRLSLPTREAALVVRLLEFGPAAQAGLKVDDVILSVNDQRVGSVTEFTSSIKKLARGEKVNLRLIRDRQEMDLSFFVGSWAKDTFDAALRGSHAGMRFLATFLSSGTRFKKDVEGARRWYKTAALAGDAKSGFWLSRELRIGGNLYAKDVPAAKKWLILCAGQGSSDCMVGLAQLYHGDNGHPKNYKRSAYWNKKAIAASNHRDAINNLAVLYRTGRGVKKDEGEYFRLSKLGAELGSPHATVNLGRAYFNGWGVKKNVSEALRSWVKSSKMGHSSGYAFIGDKYLRGEGVPKDRAKAISYLRQAVAMGDNEALGTLRKIKVAAYDPETIQKHLASLGYDPGPIDGKPGAKTRTAIRAFQKAEGLRVSGKPSLELQKKLAAANRRPPNRVSQKSETKTDPSEDDDLEELEILE